MFIDLLWIKPAPVSRLVAHCSLSALLVLQGCVSVSWQTCGEKKCLFFLYFTSFIRIDLAYSKKISQCINIQKDFKAPPSYGHTGYCNTSGYDVWMTKCLCKAPLFNIITSDIKSPADNKTAETMENYKDAITLLLLGCFSTSYKSFCNLIPHKMDTHVALFTHRWRTCTVWAPHWSPRRVWSRSGFGRTRWTVWAHRSRPAAGGPPAGTWAAAGTWAEPGTAPERRKGKADDDVVSHAGIYDIQLSFKWRFFFYY